jgi:ABC-type sugar transport system ATPase subunit
MVEIAKALSLNAEIIVMDEPSSCSPAQSCTGYSEIITNLQSRRDRRIHLPPSRRGV